MTKVINLKLRTFTCVVMKIAIYYKKNLTIPKRRVEAVNRRETENTKERDKMCYIKLMIEQHY